MTKQMTKEYLSFAVDLSRGAGKILRDGFNRRKRVEYKGRIDPVTEYDLKSEKYIISRIKRTFPEHAILAEESGRAKRRIAEQSQFLWVIDPLDGTVNYAHGFPMYCVSIALMQKGKPVVGAVFDPERNELFKAGLQLGSFLNERRIRVSSEPRLQRSLLATGFAYDVSTARKNNLGFFARMVKKAQAVRRAGSAAIDLCWLGAGRIDGFWEFSLHPWDTAAAALIVTEAGGKVTRLDGRPYSIFDPDILVSNNRLHTKLRKTLCGR